MDDERKDIMGLDDDGADEEIILVSKEKQRYKVSKAAAMRSILIKTTLEGGERHTVLHTTLAAPLRSIPR